VLEKNVNLLAETEIRQPTGNGHRYGTK